MNEKRPCIIGKGSCLSGRNQQRVSSLKMPAKEKHQETVYVYVFD